MSRLFPSAGKQNDLPLPSSYLAWTPAEHKRLLLALSCGATLLTLVLTLASALLLPPFDASPRVLLPPSPPGDQGAIASWARALAGVALRWDTFHFAHVARAGRVFEHEWAWFPGAPLVMRLTGRALQSLAHLHGTEPKSEVLEWEYALLGGMVASMAASVAAVGALYDLTMALVGDARLAFLAGALSLLPSSPATLRVAGYTEPFFTLCSYRGMLHCARRQWFLAACWFAAAGVFRSNGILLAGFLVWGLVVEPVLEKRKLPLSGILYALFLSLLTLSPFLYHQYSAYRLFCSSAISSPAPWCASFPPSVYTYVQAKYWNVGFLRYWTPQQIPNFALGAPPLTLLFAFSLHYLRHALVLRLRSFLYLSPSTSRSPSTRPPFLKNPRALFLRPSLAPHAIHALALALLLLFASHTQIVLRFAAALPLTYWAAAWLLVAHPRAGAWWVAWSVVWGTTSCVLWAAFLPPA